VYRAADGAVTERSAVCPHLGAIVCWNAAEKTWDCPAHGSRFDTEGNVLNGPAASGLSAVEPAKPRRRRAPKSARPAQPRRRAKAPRA
jgi:Rieske Fe-S protein